MPPRGGLDGLEGRHGDILADRQISDLFGHQQCRMDQDSQPARQIAGSLGLDKGIGEPGQRAVIDPLAGLGGGGGKTDGTMRLADSERSGISMPIARLFG